MTDRENIIGETSLQPHRTNVEYINDITVDRRLEIQQVTRLQSAAKSGQLTFNPRFTIDKVRLFEFATKWTIIAKPYKISVGQNEIICREVSRDYSQIMFSVISVNSCVVDFLLNYYIN